MNRPHPHSIVGAGEVLWDLFPTGARLGGAPTNVVCHASQLGATSALVSAVGRDELGRQALDQLKQYGVRINSVGRVDHPTGSVEVTLDGHGHPSYRITEDVAWDYFGWSAEVAELAASADAVCFGSLGQRGDVSRATIRRLLSAVPGDALRVLDVNLRAPFYDDDIIAESLELANVVKLSDEELPIVAAVCGLLGSETDILQQLAKRFELQAVALTCGAHGATLVRDAELHQQEAISTTVIDTVGAGDAYTAALTIGLLADRDLNIINSTACRIAAFVCSQAGATPMIPQELQL